MKRPTILLAVLLALGAAGAFAQHDIENPDPDPGGGSGGYGCYTCSVSNSYAHCTSHPFDNPYGWDPNYGYTSCTAHNVPPGAQGPPFCEVGGSCLFLMSDGASGAPSKEWQIRGIEVFLRQSRVISDADLNDFIAVTDFALRGEPYAVAVQKRLYAYRAEFNRLVARGDLRRELKPGDIPVTPHKPTKAPAATLATR